MLMQGPPANAAGVPGLGLAEGKTGSREPPLGSNLAIPGFILFLLGHIPPSHGASGFLGAPGFLVHGRASS